MTKDEAVKKISTHFGAYDEWRLLEDGCYSLGTYQFGALISPLENGQFHVNVGYAEGWSNPKNAIVNVVFDTLEEAKNFGMLIYTQNKPTSFDRTVVKGYPV